MTEGSRPHPIELLLVDDNDDDIVLLEESLRDSRFLNLLQVVRDGEQALAYLRRQAPYQQAVTPGLVLLDINMPRMNGFEVLSAMKADPALRSIPVVMLTTSTREEDIVRSYDGGACSFVSKPVSFDTLKDVIRQFALYWTLVSVVPPTASHVPTEG
ncbi:MAG: response regulator [Planctomycetales bacterium]